MAEFKPNMETLRAQAPMPERVVAPTETPKTEKAKRVEGKLEGITNKIKDYFSDMKTAYDAAAWELGGQTVFGRVMEGATVAGTGALLEVATQQAAGQILSGISEYFIKPKGGISQFSRGRESYTTRKDNGSYNISHDVIVEAIPQTEGKMPEAPLRVVSPDEIPADDFRQYVANWAREKWNPGENGEQDSIFKRFMRNGVVEGFDDAATMALYSFTNRILGDPLPYVPVKNLGISLAGDFISGAFGSPEDKQAAVDRKLGTGKVGKAGTFVLNALNLTNPVTIFGASLIKNSIDAYRLAFKDVRAAREAARHGGRNVMYVAEGRPNTQKPWQRNRPWQRGGGRHG